jgi:hypothetical protein
MLANGAVAHALWLGELAHRCPAIRKALEKCRGALATPGGARHGSLIARGRSTTAFHVVISFATSASTASKTAIGYMIWCSKAGMPVCMLGVWLSGARGR